MSKDNNLAYVLWFFFLCICTFNLCFTKILYCTYYFTLFFLKIYQSILIIFIYSITFNDYIIFHSVNTPHNPTYFSNIFIKKTNYKNVEIILQRTHTHTHHLDSTTNILLYLLYHQAVELALSLPINTSCIFMYFKLSCRH